MPAINLAKLLSFAMIKAVGLLKGFSARLLFDKDGLSVSEDNVPIERYFNFLKHELTVFLCSTRSCMLQWRNSLTVGTSKELRLTPITAVYTSSSKLPQNYGTGVTVFLDQVNSHDWLRLLLNRPNPLLDIKTDLITVVRYLNEKNSTSSNDYNHTL